MVNGPVAETIAATAKDGEFDLVVMGTNGRTGLRAAVVGSVAEKVVRLSEVPVLVARVSEEPRPGRRSRSR
jgi:nucleotide-binding universal stress UspA family protein